MLAGVVAGNRLGRYVLPVDQPVPLDADGFLDVPGAAWWGPGESRPQRVAELAGCAPGFVLLAPGGAGKSFVMDGLSGCEPDTVTVDLRYRTGPEIRAAVQGAIRAGGPVYLDALEDAAHFEPAVFGVLGQELTAAAALGIPWRLACRPAAWDPGLAATLREAFPGFRELKLLPLTRPTAEEFLAGAGISAGQFLDELVAARLGRLAASPQRLHAVAVHWGSTGDLPQTHAEAVSSEIDRLLTELDRGRPQPSLSAERRRRLAGRLGAIAVFTGTGRFARAADEAVPGLLGVSVLPGAPEPEEPGMPVTPADYREVLGTDLFAPAADASVEFQHQQYAEFLAAEYLAERQVGRQQVRALLGVQPDGLVPGPVIAVAAWLAAVRPALAGDLITRNALAFAQAGIELPSQELRAAVVDGLLTAAASGEIDPVPRLDLASLAHPGLETQLARHLAGSPARPDPIWWIAALAAAGTCRGLAPALRREALSPAQAPWVRQAAVTALGVLDGDDDLSALRPLLRTGPGEDPHDEVLQAVIGTLYPRLLSTADLLAVLRPQHNRGLTGYYQLLRRLGSQIPAEDLPRVLEWTAARVPAVAGDGYGDLLSGLVVRGWAEAGMLPARSALARLLAVLASDRDGEIWISRATLPWARDGGLARRRDLAVATAGQIGTGRWHALIELRLIGADDLDWLITTLPQAAAPARHALAACIPGLVLHPDARQADMILALPPDHPAYAPTSGLRAPVSTSAPVAIQWQQVRERAAKDAETLAAARSERTAQLAAALDDALADPAAWWHIPTWLSATDRSRADVDLFTGDLTTRPGWALLDSRQQEQVLDTGIEYLAVHQVRRQDWAGHQQITVGTALPDWSAVYLLTTLAQHDRGTVQTLDPALWQKWAPAIIGAWSSDAPGDQRLRCDLIGLAPPQAQPGISAAALDHLDAINEHGGLLPHGLYQHLCPRIASALAARLTAGRYRRDLALTLLGMLITNAPQSALPACRRLHADPEPGLASAAREGLAMLDPAAIVDDLDATAAGPGDLASIMPHLAITALSDDRLAVLAGIALRCFPYAQDQPLRPNAPGGDGQFQVRRFRNLVMGQLTERGQVQALGELARRSGNDTDRDAISWYLNRARERAADLALARPSPAALLRLLSRSDARLIRRASDLVEVMITQLEQLQHELTYQGASREIWDFHGDSATCNNEDDITDWIRRKLRPRLTTETTIDREVQVEPRRQGIGTRIDLTVTAPAATHPLTTPRVITEAKLVTNDSLPVAMNDQLIRRYLIPEILQYGIYLIYWIPPEQRRRRKTMDTDPVRLLDQMEQQAASAAPDHLIKPVLLDISHK